VEATKLLKPSMERVALGDLASMQAVTWKQGKVKPD
jgi:hypothetical protein